MTTAAAIDRLVHRSTIIELNVPSVRLEEARANQRIASTKWIPNDSGCLN